MKKYIDILRPFFLAPFILYIFDKMAVVLNLFIPINVLTILIVGLFDIFGLILLITIYLVIF